METINKYSINELNNMFVNDLEKLENEVFAYFKKIRVIRNTTIILKGDKKMKLKIKEMEDSLKKGYTISIFEKNSEYDFILVVGSSFAKNEVLRITPEDYAFLIENDWEVEDGVNSICVFDFEGFISFKISEVE